MLKQLIMPIIGLIITVMFISVISTWLVISEPQSPFDEEPIDLSLSLVSEVPVDRIISQRQAATIELIVVSFLIAIVLAPLMPLLDKIKTGRSGLLSIGSIFPAIPFFWFALILAFYLGAQLRIIPMGGRCPINLSQDGCPIIFQRLEYLIAPALSIAIVLLGQVWLNLKSDEETRWYGSMLMTGLNAGVLVTAIVVVESIFSFPGIARVYNESIIQFDLPLALAVLMRLTIIAGIISTVFQLLLNALRHLTKNTVVDDPFKQKNDSPVIENTIDSPPERFDIDNAGNISDYFLADTEEIPGEKAKSEQTGTLQDILMQPIVIVNLSLIVICLLLLPVISGILNLDPLSTDPQNTLAAPSSEYPLGTDNLGRDNLARLLEGTRTSVMIALLSGIIATLSGLIMAMLFNLIPVLVPVLRSFSNILPVVLLIMFFHIFYRFRDLNITLAIGLLLSFTVAVRWLRNPLNPLKNPAAVTALLCFAIATSLITETTLGFLGFSERLPAITLGSLLTGSHVYFLRGTATPVIVIGLVIFILARSFYAAGQSQSLQDLD